MEDANDSKHLENLKAVCKQLQECGLLVKLLECAFLAPSVAYFGLLVSENGFNQQKKRTGA